MDVINVPQGTLLIMDLRSNHINMSNAKEITCLFQILVLFFVEVICINDIQSDKSIN